MKKLHIIIGVLLFTTAANAQMKIKDPLITSGTTAPDPNAILELQSNNKALLMPRVQLTATNSYLPLTGTPVAGMAVYNIGPAGSGPTAVTAGYYYNDGTNWIKLGPATVSAGWTTIGNAGTIPTTNFMGTTDDEDVIFKRNNILAGTLNNSSSNTSWGVSALLNNSGTDNTAVGTNSMLTNTSGLSNTSMGSSALYTNSTGSYNTAVGTQALKLNTSDGGTAVGYKALASTTTGGGNVAVGQMAGFTNQTGTDNVLIGANADVSTTGLTDATALGYGAIVHASNTMQFGDANVSGWGFGPGIPVAGTSALIVGSNSTNGDGAYLTSGGVWMNASDRNLKEDITDPDGNTILSQVRNLEIPKWKYKGTNEYHIGPMAEDFYNAFKLGNDDKHVSTVDPAGIALICIKALAIKNDSLKTEMDSQQVINSNLQQQINDIKATITELQRGNNQSSGTSTLVNMDEAKLDQNAPNPYSTTTIIGYYIPESTNNAQLIVTDVNGQILKTVSLNEKGNGTITLNAGSLTSGHYFYSLIIDGQKIDTKEMVLTK